MTSTEESSFVLPSNPSDSYNASDNDEMDSLPSSSDTESTISGDEDNSDAEKEWHESLQQIELLLTIMVVPYIGKYFGRKAAYWGWGKFMEWKFPVEVTIADPGAFKAAGIVGAASAL
ncbi:hypothetical protein BT63DRAFT_449224 [Microthyrium microscopicum]|uniref:Uncharacterized protein n=1 Tax=Microthyrium microscopicum TaxID=703497 RepID=A0A6A6UPM0_9PEZI|nr:hypothetical protein BT63DRAFT_449224 [Microthyrium microscopicum]